MAKAKGKGKTKGAGRAAAPAEAAEAGTKKTTAGRGARTAKGKRK